MKVKRLLVLMSSVMLLAGCQSTTSQPSQVEKNRYDGMTGKETYEAAVKYFNENITYYKNQIVEGENQSTVDTYAIDDQISIVTKAIYRDGETSTLNYNIVSGNEFHTLFMLDSLTYKYNLIDDYTEHQTEMYVDLFHKESYELIDATREDQDENIHLTIKAKKSQKYQETDEESEITYYMNEMTINKDGYICSEKITYYTNEKFDEVSLEGKKNEYTDFNQKTKSDFEKEVELMKSCDGLNDEEVKDKLGMNKL